MPENTEEHVVVNNPLDDPDVAAVINFVGARMWRTKLRMLGKKFREKHETFRFDVDRYEWNLDGCRVELSRLVELMRELIDSEEDDHIPAQPEARDAIATSVFIRVAADVVGTYQASEKADAFFGNAIGTAMAALIGQAKTD